MTIEFNAIGKVGGIPVGSRKPVGDAPRSSATTVAAEPSLVRMDALDAMRVPPIDHERVAEVRSAIARGDYPIRPAKVSDALIAASLLLSGS